VSAPTIFPAESSGVTPEALAAAVALLHRSSAVPATAPAMVPVSALPAASPWAAGAAAPAALAAQGVLVQLTVPLGQGYAAPVYLLFGPEHAASTEAVAALVGALHQQGAPVKVYEPRSDDRGGGGYGGGGYGGRGRGGYGGRRRFGG